ncbi:hypothetical protein QBC41DRAFT_330685, partial [Cercophora samala]
MAELCLACLHHHDNLLSFQSTTIEEFPFTRHAQKHWMAHATDSNREHVGREALNDLLSGLLSGDYSGAYLNWSRLSLHSSPGSTIFEIPEDPEMPIRHQWLELSWSQIL